ncbi:MAG: cyclic pyranopterin monophosphate synthase MoaC [Bacillota bacterium]|nr:cyclic pyranopterin monophosphate synthase MoaC [Bacillota bacterium]
MAEFTHFNERGMAHMVDVGGKEATAREAVAHAAVRLSPGTFRQVVNRQLAKGDVLGVAQVAGVMAAKKTSELIPLCHPLPLTKVDLSFTPDESTATIHIAAAVRTVARTGVEMEALTAASVAALTVYDMCKAVEKGIEITDIYLVEKRGGKSGEYRRGER